MGLDLSRLQKKVTGGMKLPDLPVSNNRLENITKVTFETDDGRTFTFFSAWVWKLNFNGNLAYQIRGEYPDLEKMLPRDPADAPVVKPIETDNGSENK